MDTRLPNPALAAGAPVAIQQPVLTPAAVRGSFQRINDVMTSVVYYGLLIFGMVFPVVATIYALIVY